MITHGRVSGEVLKGRGGKELVKLGILRSEIRKGLKYWFDEKVDTKRIVLIRAELLQVNVKTLWSYYIGNIGNSFIGNSRLLIYKIFTQALRIFTQKFVSEDKYYRVRCNNADLLKNFRKHDWLAENLKLSHETLSESLEKLIH